MSAAQRKAGAGGHPADHSTRDHSNPIDKILQRLESVKKTGPDKWLARCPAHDDRRPSLSVREAEDGKVLLKCWAGCGAGDVVAAMGLSLADLFPGDRRSLHQHGTGPMRRPFGYRDALQGISHEATVARLIVAAVNRGDELDADSLDRLALAEERIAAALQAAGGAR